MPGTSLDVDDIDEAREAIAAGHYRAVIDVDVKALSLGASIEVACWGTSRSDGVAEVLRQWEPHSDALRMASIVLGGGRCDEPDDHAAPVLEVRRCPTRAELQNGATAWCYYLDRFRRSLVQRLDLTAKEGYALAGALAEMVDNVVEHSGLGDEPLGVVGYEVTPEQVSFAVGDLGRGVLHSLRENPEHRGVDDDQAALLAAVTQGASRRRSGTGHGFRTAHEALADMEGLLTFRRRPVVARWARRRRSTASSVQLPGNARLSACGDSAPQSFSLVGVDAVTARC